MRILSGIQPSGRLHIGNYFGMIKPAMDMQHDGEVFLFIANYHALTSVHDGDALREATREAALDLLACGLDPQKTVFFKQSDVPEVTELTWLLSTVTPMGLLERCHSYKDKTARGVAASHALFSYPVLMAADILSYRSELVPVGQDQKQHVEVTRDIAIKFNNLFGAEIFKIPEPSILENVAVVPGVDGQKMSKTYQNTIDLFGSQKAIRKQVMRIVTDSTPLEEPKDPDTCNVFALYRLFAGEEEQAALAADYRRGGFGYGDAKTRLFEALWNTLGPFHAKRAELEQQPGVVDEVLARGAERARAEARVTLDAARNAVGLT